MNVEQLFQELERDSHGTSDPQLYRRLLPDSALDLRIAFTVANRHRLFAVCGKPTVDDLGEMRGLKVLCDHDGSALVLELVEPRFGEIFSALISDLCGVLSAGHTECEPISVVVDRLALWKRLFSDSLAEGLSPEQQRGLYCELLCLQDTLIPSVGPSGAVSAWVAPTGAAQDFRTAGCAIEVKSRFRKGSGAVRISSEDQLTADGRVLFLFVYALDSGRGKTLNQLVDQCFDGLASVPAVQLRFADALIQSGYLDVHRHRYNDSQYEGSVTCFEVRNGFPRIARDDLSPGVLRVAYDIELSACVPYLVAHEGVCKILGGAIG